MLKKTIQPQVEKFFRDPATGLIFSYLDKATLKPATEDFFPAGNPIKEGDVPGVTLAELYLHENCGMVTGAYMQSEILRYVRTGAADALANAQRCMQALWWVYQTGKQLATGFFPKVYGGRFSNETSTDQVLYACCACEAFYPYANPEEQEQIREFIPALLRFWTERDYRFHYFQFFDDNWQWPLMRFPPLLILAHKFSGDKFFHDEYLRLLEHTREPESLELEPDMSKHEPDEFELANQAWSVSAVADIFTMNMLNFDLLLRHDPENPLADAWREGIHKIWFMSKDAICEDGRYLTTALYDFDTLEVRRVPLEGIDKRVNFGSGGAKSAWSTMIARAAMQALPHCPELAEEVLPMVRLVLEKLDFEDCTYYDEPERFAPELQYKPKLLSGDSVANWLWARELLLEYELGKG